MKAKINRRNRWGSSIVLKSTVDAQLLLVKTFSAIIKKYNGGVASLYLIAEPHLLWVGAEAKSVTVLSNTVWNIN